MLAASQFKRAAASRTGSGKWSPISHEKFENIERIELERTSDEDEQPIDSGSKEEAERSDRDEPENENQLQDNREKRIGAQASSGNNKIKQDELLNILAGHDDGGEAEEKDQEAGSENQRGYERTVIAVTPKEIQRQQKEALEGPKKNREHGKSTPNAPLSGQASPGPGAVANR